MMSKLIFVAISAYLLSCFSSGNKQVVPSENDRHAIGETKYVWRKVLDSGEWKKSYNFAMFEINHSLWIFHPDGNWSSNNGKDWTKSTLPNAIFNLAFLKYIPFRQSVYGLGHFEGNIENFTFTPEIYQTTNLKEWATISKNSNLPPRFFYYPFIFDNKIWIIGGQDKATTFADIWNSADGVNWVKQKDRTEFGERFHSKVVQLNGKLFLLNNDVWSSTDGLLWQKETDKILKGETIFGYEALVYDNKIWLIGCNRNGNFLSQVLVSNDGRNWQSQQAPWTPRGGVAAAVFNGKIYMTGGKYGGTPEKPDFVYSNDLWTLEKE